MLEGKIAAIYNDRFVLINLGEEHGVSLGMKFAVMSTTAEIVDPDNPENTMAGITFMITTLLAKTVFQKFTYCEILDPYYTSADFEPIDEGAGIVAPDEDKLADSVDFRVRRGVKVQELEVPAVDTDGKKQA